VLEGNLWEEARRLRAGGWSLRQIARHLDVSLSSASVWTRDVPTPRPTRTPASVPLAPRVELLRWCSRCARFQPESNFNRHPTGLQWWCRDCFKTYYAERRAHHRRRNDALKAIRVHAAQVFVLEFLGAHPCLDCGEADPIVLEFDHLGAKRAEVSTLVSRGVREPVLAAEIARCEIVCANCHRRRTARRGAGGDWEARPTAAPSGRRRTRAISRLCSMR
jgi:5-methylcytosine-specific restriction endonuclease McrA